ncbi:MAG: TylF/MycF family methyltransferase, partial [Acidobacteriota bacterium]|nr:TylF/MycF family methyltransferase [Acidobacteriota bacterium]
MTHNPPGDAAELYLELIKKVLTRSAFPHEYRPLLSPASADSHISRLAHLYLGALLAKLHFGLYRRTRIDPAKRAQGTDWPAEAETMAGTKRLDQVHSCIKDVLASNVPGDLIETG